MQSKNMHNQHAFIFTDLIKGLKVGCGMPIDTIDKIINQHPLVGTATHSFRELLWLRAKNQMHQNKSSNLCHGIPVE
jgi:hypothetical protein